MKRFNVSILAVILFIILSGSIPVHHGLTVYPIDYDVDIVLNGIPVPSPWVLGDVVSEEYGDAYGADIVSGLSSSSIVGLYNDSDYISWAYIDNNGTINIKFQSTAGTYTVYDVRHTFDGEFYGIINGLLEKYSFPTETWLWRKTLGVSGVSEIDFFDSVNVVVIAVHTSSYLGLYGIERINYNTLWHKEFPVHGVGGSVDIGRRFAMVRYDDSIVLALLNNTGSNEQIILYHIDPATGEILYNDTLSFTRTMFPCLFRIRDLVGYNSTIGYTLFGTNTIYLYNPVSRDWIEYSVSKPIYYMVSGSRLGSYYALLYGTNEDDDYDWEAYITDLAGHEYRLPDIYHPIEWPVYVGFTSKTVLITYNYIAVPLGTKRLLTYRYDTNVSFIHIYSDTYVTVWIDGSCVSSISNGSWFKAVVEPGYHNITVIGEDRYSSIEFYLNVGEIAVLINPVKPIARLIPANATVYIVSVYEVINVYVDGDYIGSISPGENITLSLPPGKHNITLTAVSRKPAMYMITLAPEEAVTIIDPFKPVYLPGTIESPQTPTTQTPQVTPVGGEESITIEGPVVENPLFPYHTIALAIALAGIAVVLVLMYRRKRVRRQ